MNSIYQDFSLLCSDEEYSRLMRDVGSVERVDKDDPEGTNISLPAWVDQKKLKKWVFIQFSKITNHQWK